MASNPDSCLLCGGSPNLVLDGLRDNQWGSPGIFAVHRCRACGVELTLPRLTAGELRQLAERHEAMARDSEAGERPARAGPFRTWLMQSWLYRLWLRMDGDVSFQLARGRARLLDVGGAGESPDVSNSMVEADKRGELQPAASYDVIVLVNTLGHARDPRGTLRDLRGLLAEEGELWISLPNAASLFREVFGRDWINWHVPFRMVHFGPSALRRLLAEEGFDIRSFSCVTPTLWLTQSCLVTLYGQPGAPTERLRKPLLIVGWMLTLRLFFFPTLFLINRAGRGDCLIVRARKTGL